MNTLQPSTTELSAVVDDLHSTISGYKTAEQQLEKRRQQLDEYLAEHGDMANLRLTTVVLLFVASCCMAVCMTIEWFLNLDLWAELVGRWLAAGFAVIFAALGVIASACIGEIWHPVLRWLRPGVQGRSDDLSPAVAYQQQRSIFPRVVFWIGVGMAMVLLTTLGYFSWKRVSLQIAAGYLPPDAFYQWSVPVMLMAAEIVTGVFFLRYVAYVCYRWRTWRLRRKISIQLGYLQHVKAQIRHQWQVIQAEVASLKDRKVSILLNLSDELKKLLEQVFDAPLEISQAALEQSPHNSDRQRRPWLHQVTATSDNRLTHIVATNSPNNGGADSDQSLYQRLLLNKRGESADGK